MRYQIFIGESRDTLQYVGTAPDWQTAQREGKRILEETYSPATLAVIRPIVEVREHPDNLRMSEWPKHPDGRPMKMGEMTPEQRREQAAIACKRLEAAFKHPRVQESLSRILSDPSPDSDEDYS
jgi:hypothetical protein